MRCSPHPSLSPGRQRAGQPAQGPKSTGSCPPDLNLQQVEGPGRWEEGKRAENSQRGDGGWKRTDRWNERSMQSVGGRRYGENNQQLSLSWECGGSDLAWSILVYWNYFQRVGNETLTVSPK